MRVTAWTRKLGYLTDGDFDLTASVEAMYATEFADEASTMIDHALAARHISMSVVRHEWSTSETRIAQGLPKRQGS